MAMGSKRKVSLAQRNIMSFWNSKSLLEKQELLKVSHKAFVEHLDTSKDESLKKVLSFVNINKTFKFWLCCICNDKIPLSDDSYKFADVESLIQHVRKQHLDIDELLEEFQEADFNWAEMLLNCPREQVEALAAQLAQPAQPAQPALKLIEDQSECQYVLVDSSNIGIDGLLSSIFKGPTSAEQWVSLKCGKEEKTKEGMNIFHRLKKEFSNLKELCQKKYMCLRYAKALEKMEANEGPLQLQMHCMRDIELAAISAVLKEAEDINIFQVDENDTSREKVIQRQKDACSVELSKIDARIMRNATDRQKSEVELCSVSCHDYQTLILSSVKTIIQASLKSLREKEADAAKEALSALAKLEPDGNKSLSKEGHHSKQKPATSKSKKKKNKKVAGGIQPLVPYEETAGQGNRMGAGRKPMLSLAEEDQQSSNSSSVNNYRNLGKKDLGGFIFGCTVDTINECLLNQIFGLPSQHLTYVENIKLGLPLFLFNYSDRKLHGIFEASGPGQLNIDPHAWSVDGSEITQFPAQVPFVVTMECQPLPEELFRPIIIVNYYAENLFKFELDHNQARDLVLLFKSPPTMGSTSTASRVLKDAPINESKDSPASISKVDTDAPSAYLEVESGFPHDPYKWKSVDPGRDPNARNEEGAKTVEFPFLGPSGISVNEENQMLESHSEKEVITCPNGNGEGVVDVPHGKNGAPLQEEDIFLLEAPLVSSSDHKYEDISINLSNLQSLVNQLRQENGELKDLSVEQLQKMERKWVESEIQVQLLQNQLHQLEGRVMQLESQFGVDKSVYILGGCDGISWLSSLDCYSPSTDIIKSLRPMSFPRPFAASATLDGQIYLFGGEDSRIFRNYDNTDSRIQYYKIYYNTVSKIQYYKIYYNTVESYNPLTNEWTSCPSLLQEKGCLAGATLNNKVYAIGGTNGLNHFSAVEMFDPNTGRWTFAPPMFQKRSCLAAAELNGAIYAVGGCDENNYLKSAERFDPRESSWFRLQCMHTSRGWHSLAVLNEKLYALAGFDGIQALSSAEVFDPRTSTWMAGDEMKVARVFSDSAVMGEAIYSWGGTTGTNAEVLLDTVECYKEGQGWQLTNLKGVGKRYSFTSVIL